MTVELVLFILLAVIAVGAAVGMLSSRNAVHSALFLVLNFAAVAFLFLLLGAPFIAMVQVTVYAGAIMVLFLFVIMLLGAEMLRQPGAVLPWQPPLTLVLGVLFAGVAGLFFLNAGPGLAALPPAFASVEAEREFGGPHAVGRALFTDFALPFQAAAFLLIAGMVGAVALARDEKKKQP